MKVQELIEKLQLQNRQSMVMYEAEAGDVRDIAKVVLGIDKDTNKQIVLII